MFYNPILTTILSQWKTEKNIVVSFGLHSQNLVKLRRQKYFPNFINE